MRKLIYISLSTLCLLSCQSNTGTEGRQGAKNYFSVTDFFKSEIVRLQAAGLTVQKTVSVNDTTETKNVKIQNWEQELKIFTESDINKASWDGEFKTTQHGDTIVYSTSNPKIPVKNLKVVKHNGKIKLVELVTIVDNYLYTSHNILNYYPDSAYSITNEQTVRFLKKKNYQVNGKFIP